MTGAVGAGRSRRGPWTFYTTMALVIAFVVASGFGPSYSASLAPPGLPYWVHLHGAVMTSWILLFIAQTLLIRQRALALHRTLGFASIALVVIMIPLGLATDLLAIKRDAVPPFFTPATILAADMCDLLLFVGLFAAAVVLRRRRDWHPRLMLGATVLLSWPAIGRLRPLGWFGLDGILPLSMVVLAALALVGPIHDLTTRRRIHPASLWAPALAIALLPLYTIVAMSGPVRALAASVTPIVAH